VSPALISLDEFNELRLEDLKLAQVFQRRNGIACPTCGNEMYDSGSYMQLTDPPMQHIHCLRCGYRGARVV
jgi:DNA-directed RNA polymerase subunit RPC12/RpoP